MAADKSPLTRFDAWLADEGSPYAALACRQELTSVETPPGGPEAPIFPPTFAAADNGDDGEPGDYDISTSDGGKNVCLIDSVGSSANRAEPVFRPDKCGGKYAGLVPQVVIKAGTEKEVNLLDVGHRAGDAIVRFTSELGETVYDAFRAYARLGDCEPLARIAPTSLVFGVWDSRSSQEKISRTYRSVTIAHDVRRLTRSAQYNPAVSLVDEKLVDEKLNVGGVVKNPLSQEGFNDNPSVGTPGGVIPEGGVVRYTQINLPAIRRLRSARGPEATLALRRYVLGLNLVAAAAGGEDRYNLREGCLLRQRPGTPKAWRLVPFEGEDEDYTLTEADALAFAEAAAADFGVAAGGVYEFDAEAANKWLKASPDTRKKLRGTGPITKIAATLADTPSPAATEEVKTEAESSKGGKSSKKKTARKS